MALWAREISFPDVDAVQAVRPEHREHLQVLLDQGALRMSGPWGSGDGALLVYDAPDEATARSYVEADPYFREGVVTELALREWNVVFGG
ncbi:MAG: hypothetical protein JWM25_155 [Thermoleophilia bacterium]|nr:hypothetical protein [Thermoleophilia bacterium]MCZ4495572.1 hypothetical protein [Thermoleophilia bacterium]